LTSFVPKTVELSKMRRCVSELASARICGDRNQCKQLSLTADVMQEGYFQDAMRHVKIQCKRRVSQISKQIDDEDDYLERTCNGSMQCGIQSKGLGQPNNLSVR
jgi:hypothetical protein